MTARGAEDADEIRHGRGRRRWTSALLLVLVVGGGALTAAGVSYAQQSDLRDLPSLERARADVVGEDHRRRAPDLVEVRFDAGGRQVTASIPSSVDADDGDQVQVAYVASAPERVRLVTGWAPPWRSWLLVAGVVPVAVLMTVLRRAGRVRARRAGAALRRRARGG